MIMDFDHPLFDRRVVDRRSSDTQLPDVPLGARFDPIVGGTVPPKKNKPVPSGDPDPDELLPPK